MTAVSLITDSFIPTTSFGGGESPAIIRGANVKIRAGADRARIECYQGHKNISEDYALLTELITGTIAFTTTSTTITGAGTSFTTELHLGQMIQAANREPIVVNQITDDTHFIAERLPTTAGVAQAARYLPTMFEINRQRGVLRRGNGLTKDRKDIIFVGDGQLYLNGVATGFIATRAPKRLQRETDGTYTEMPIGFATTPIPTPIGFLTAVAGGSKGMQAGKYSLLFSWYNSITRGFSNTSPVQKIDNIGGLDLTIAASGRINIDFTLFYNIKNFVDANVVIATGAIDTTAAHGMATGDSFKLRNFGGAFPVPTAGGVLVAGKAYYAIVVDATHIKVARTKYLALAGTAVVYLSAAGGGTNHIYILPANADGTKIWGSLSGGGVTAVNQSNFSQGAWLDAGNVLLSDLDSSNQYNLEYLDAELGATASGDNDPPPDCEFVTTFANIVQYISALGKSTSVKALGTSPGNYVLPTKSTNDEAAPSDWRVSVGDDITGFANGVGRLFTLTATGVPFVTPTGRTELARLSPTLLDLPFTSRPFWTKGGINPANIIVIQGDVFVYTGKTLLRSPSNADDNNVVPFEIGLPIEDLTVNWFDGFTHLVHDPQNQELCIVSSATKKNSNGWWISEILPLNLRTGRWQPIITVDDSSRDMIVSGTATINGRMEFLAGGHTQAGDDTTSTFRYDERPASKTGVSYYFCFQPQDDREERRAKQIKAIRATGRMSSPIVQIYGASWSQNTISVEDIEAGTNALSNVISLPTSTGIQVQFEKNYLVPNLQLWGVRFAGTWDGSGSVDRIDELVAVVDVTGIAQ